MGMGYSGSSAWTISDENLKAIIPEEFDAFMNTLSETMGYDFDSFARLVMYGVDDAIEEDDTSETQVLITAYNTLRDSFHTKTKLTIQLNYHEIANGDRYDDVDGGFWDVQGVMDYTHAGRRLADKLTEIRWVEFG